MGYIPPYSSYSSSSSHSGASNASRSGKIVPSAEYCKGCLKEKRCIDLALGAVLPQNCFEVAKKRREAFTKAKSSLKPVRFVEYFRKKHMGPSGLGGGR